MDIDMWIRALKAARASAEVSQEALAGLVKWSPSTIAAIETGRRRPTTEFAMAADQALGTGGLLAELLEVADRQRSPAWFTPWRGYESEAVRLRSSEPCLVPGLLQTEEYARAIISAGNLSSPAQVEDLVRARLERQGLLCREDPPQCVFILDEAALHRPVGGPRVLDGQLAHLQEVAQLPNIRIHVVPLGTGEHVGLGGGFLLADLPDGDQVVYLENAAWGQVIDDPGKVLQIRRKWDSILGEALSARGTLDLITKLRMTQ